MPLNAGDDGPLSQVMAGLRAVFDHLQEGVTVQSPSGGLAYANAAAVRALGFPALPALLSATPQDLAARWDVFDDVGRAVSLADLPGRHALQGQEAHERTLRFRVRATGEERWSVVRAAPLRDGAGRLVGAVNFFRDVTEDRRLRERQAFLAEASALLGRTLDPSEVLSALARLCVPLLGDWCAVDVVDEGGAIRQVAVAHVDPAKVELGREIARRWPPRADDPHGVPEVIRSGASFLAREVPEAALAASARDEEHRRLLLATGSRSCLIVPLKARGRVLGALTFTLAGADPRRYGPEDAAFAEDLASRAAVAVDNARLYAEAQAAHARRGAVLDASLDAIVTIDARGRITEWNPAAERVFGWSRVEVMGREMAEVIVPPDLREGHRMGLARVVATGSPSILGQRLELPALRRDGSVFPAELAIVAIPAPGQASFTGFLRDITYRKQAEEALRLSDERFRLLARATDDAVWDWDVRTGARWWNDNAQALLPAEDLRAGHEGWTRRLHPEDRGRVEAGLQAAVEGNAATWQDEYRLLRRDGTHAQVLDRGFIIRDAAGAAVRMVGSMMDITERKRTEEALRESEARHRFLAEHSLDIISRMAPDGRVLYVSPAVKAVLGYEPDEFVAMDRVALVHPDDRDRVGAASEPARAAEDAYVATLRFRHKEGRYVWLEAVARNVRDAAGRLVETIAVSRDVTERKDAEEALRASQARLEEFQEGLPTALFSTTPDGRFLQANRAFARILGFEDKEAFLATPVPRLYADPAQREQVTAILDRDGEVQGFETRFLRRDGSPVWVSIRARAVRDAGGAVLRYEGSIEDVTARKEAEAELQRVRHNLERILESAGEGIYGVDAEGTTTFMNAAALKMLGLAAEQAVGRKLHAVIHHTRADGRPYPARECPIYQAAHHGRGSVCADDVFWRADGTSFPVEYVTTPLRDGDRLLGAVTVFTDVTRRRAADAELHESAQRLRAALEASATGTFQWDLATNALEWDDNLDRLFGLPPGRTARHIDQFAALVHPDDRAAVRAALARCVEEGADIDLEFRVVWPDGTVRWLLDRGSMIRDAQGRPRSMTGACTDITARKRAEEGLRRQGHLLSWQHRVLAGIAQGAPLHETLETLCREAESQTPGRHYTALLLDEEGRRLRHGAAPSLPPHYNAAMDGIPVGEGVGSCGTAAHRRAPVVVADIAEDPLWKDFRDLALPLGLRACWSTPILGSDGRLLGTWAVYGRAPGGPSPEDDEMVRVATRLAGIAIERARTQDAQGRLAAIVQGSDDAIYAKSPEGRIVEWNAGAERLYGYAREEILGKPIQTVVPPERIEEEAAILARIARGERVPALETVRLRKDGTRFPVSLSVSPIHDAQGRIVGASAIVRDITDRKRLEADLRERAEQLARLAESLERSNRELDQFAYVTSHDLKAPLRGIANLSRWIEEDLGDRVNAEARGHLELLRGRVNRMEALIDAILEYSRVGRKKGKVEPVPTRRLLEDVVDLLAPPRGFEVRLPDEMPTVRTERARLQQVFMNLVGNAIKHHPEKEKGVVAVGVEDAGAFWRFSVSDNGRGIPRRFHEKVFAIFQTLEARDKVEGTGIGLAIVKKVVESKGGRIELESDEGQGATFRFTWPKAEAGGDRE